jgi:hypothetical protein
VPRYRLVVVDGNSRILLRDSEGAEFSDLGAAKKEAVGWAQDFGRHDFPESIQTWKILIVNEKGEVIITTPLSEVRSCRTPRSWSALGCFVTKFDLSFGSRILAGLLAAAMLIVIGEATLKTGPAPEIAGNYHTASFSIKTSVVAVRFVPNASLVDIAEFLNAYKASLVDGPHTGGFYNVRIANAILPQKDLAQIVARITQEKVVEFAAIAQ